MPPGENVLLYRLQIILSHALTCDLMLQIFTIGELLKVGQRILSDFDERINNIFTQIGAFDTLSLYRVLILALRPWTQSFLAEDSSEVMYVV